MHKEVTLSTGETLRIYPVPSYAVVTLGAQIATRENIGEPPMLSIPTAAGHSEPWPDTSPESEAYQAFLRKKRALEAKQREAADEMTMLVALRDVKLPESDDWFAPFRYSGLAMKEGDGKRLDYIRYHLLADVQDMKLVTETINAISWPVEERIQAAMESFPSNGGRNGAGQHSNEGERSPV